MKSRSHVHEESFDVSPERMFDLMITPSAIRRWWGASRAIVDAREGGVWTAAWGDEDDSDHVSTATLVEFDPPRRLAMKYGGYYAKSGALPFKFADEAVTVFTIEPNGEGCILRVEQTGFPCDPVADEFYAACETGWKDTFRGIRYYLHFIHPNSPEEEPEIESHLTPEQEFRVSSLSPKQIAEIDRAILANSSDRPRKVAHVVGGAIGDLKSYLTGIPDTFFSRRVRKLVGEGKLEAEGNLDFMRFSEIKLTSESRQNDN